MTPEQTIYYTALDELKSKGLPNYEFLALCMVAQSKHESNNYTSHLFKANNNAFGYTYFQRSLYQVKQDVTAQYAKYHYLSESALEVADWISRRIVHFQDVNNLLSYARELRNAGYYYDTEANYLRGLKRNWVATIAPIKGLQAFIYKIGNLIK